MGYVYLAIAIMFEVMGTTALKLSNEFTRVLPSMIVVVGYGVSFYFLSLVLKTIPMGVAYAIWSGVGIVLLAIIGAVAFKQIPDAPAMIGMLLIIAGVVVIRMFSKAEM